MYIPCYSQNVAVQFTEQHHPSCVRAQAVCDPLSCFPEEAHTLPMEAIVFIEDADVLYRVLQIFATGESQYLRRRPEFRDTFKPPYPTHDRNRQ